VKKGRHRRFEEARSLKRATFGSILGEREEPCAECGAPPGQEHASWCLAESDELDDYEDTPNGVSGDASHQPDGSSGASKPEGG
jgi:hypothetical protein